MQEHNDLAQTNGSETHTTPLQSMNFTDILDGMFSLYRSHFRLFLTIVAVYFVIGFGIDQITVLLIQSGAVSNTNEMLFGFTILCSSVLSVWVVAGVSYASAHTYLNSEIASKDALRQAWQRFWPYLGSGILWSLAVVGLCIAIIGVPVIILQSLDMDRFFIIIVGILCAIVSIPFAIYFAVRWGLYTLPVLFEETTARNALRRSTELVKGTWWRVFGIMLAIFLVSSMISFILAVSFEFLLSWVGVPEPEEATEVLERLRRQFMPFLSEIGWFAYAIRRLVDLGVAAITMPIGIIGSTLLYFDLRIRKEAFDIEMQVTD